MKTFTKDELKAILEKHLLWLKTRFSSSPQGERAYLRDADLQDADLKGAYLHGADLKGAYLHGADLKGAYLRDADLKGAYLKGAYLKDADLQGADLQGAYLRDAYLQGADLRDAYLKDADLQDADLQGAYLRDAYLRDAYLKDADLKGAYLKGADLRDAYLQGADLQGADLRDADLRDAYLQDAYLQGENGENKVKFHFFHCPGKGAFTAYKSVSDGRGKNVVLELQIPASAKRVSSMIGRKCRASKAKVIRAFDSEQTTFYSRHDHNFVYEVGQTAKCPDFDDDVRIECTRGIHFFITRLEAEEW